MLDHHFYSIRYRLTEHISPGINVYHILELSLQISNLPSAALPSKNSITERKERIVAVSFEPESLEIPNQSLKKQIIHIIHLQ